ncbi:MAG: hypothetical protein ACFCD0_24355 [Gemmataceae bacterium]
MAIRIFTIPIQDDGQAQTKFNNFVGSHNILFIHRQWVWQGNELMWCFCVD